VLDRQVTVFCLSAVFLVIGWTVVDRTGVSAMAPLIAAAGIVIGIPHGAVDHLVPGWASQRWSQPAHLALVVGVYALITSLAALALLRAPDISFAAFLVVSALHFGWAEATFAAERGGDSVPQWRNGWWEAVVHGSVVVAIPLWSIDGQATLKPLVPGLADQVAAVPTSGIVGAVVAICGVSAISLIARRHVIRAVELIVVLALFLVVPALAAFGVYFGLWHSARHTARLMDVFAAGRPPHVQLARFARAAAIPTLAALLVLGLLWSHCADAGVVMTGVSVLLALTFPHVVVVAMLDRYRRACHTESGQDRVRRGRRRFGVALRLSPTPGNTN